MGKILHRALEELSKLPERDQEAAGARILTDLESERRWDDLFARSPDLLAEMADEAIREDDARPFSVTPAEKRVLLESIAQADRGEFVDMDDLLKELDESSE